MGAMEGCLAPNVENFALTELKPVFEARIKGR